MKDHPGIVIDGSSAAGEGEAIEIVNPATEEMIATMREASDAQVDAAVTAARARFDSGEWSRAAVEKRQAVLREIANAIESHRDELAEIETRDTGIVLKQTQGRHVVRAAYNFRFFADYIGQMEGEFYEQDPDYLTFVRRHPVGVAALIAPWNAPIALGGMKIAGAIAFGNSCVIKPSEFAAMGITRLVEVINGTSLPSNVVNLVNGRGHTVGDRLVRQDAVAAVSFTGGTPTGRKIMAAAGEGLKPSTTELGGKSANIIFDDADFEQALDGALLGIFSNNGQQCLAGSRILVQESIADDFIARFVERARNIRVGDPMDAATEIGPLANRAHMERVLSYLDKARSEGAQVLLGGGRPEHLDKGYYINPIAVRVETNASSVCQEEIFGPFASFLTFRDEDEAFRIANDTAFGLVSYVWSRDVYRVLRAQEELHSGVVWINTPMMRELRAPFGGFGESGVGAEGGKACEALYTLQKTVTTPRAPMQLPKLGQAGS